MRKFVCCFQVSGEGLMTHVDECKGRTESTTSDAHEGPDIIDETI